MAKKFITPKSKDISRWYTDVIKAADLADYGPAKGTMIFKPYGYGIWEEVQAAMDPMIKDRGVENAYFPLFIPMSLLDKEKSHVEGFSPELAVVTHGGGEELSEPLAIRPTSETIMYDSYSKWIQSWRDLPMMINQWNNVVRWELRTYLFMRTSEFLWQEGHTAHATHAEAIQMKEWAMELYEKIYKDYFALYGFVGSKSANERFAGADDSMTYEALMPSGKALQSATSHDLGQNFSKAFDISFQNKQGKNELVWQTSWGLSTRSIGGLILMHGDDDGLRLPPRLAPVQVVILPVRNSKQIAAYCEQVEAKLNQAGVRTKVDDREDETIGFRINKWELRGVPLRLEIGEAEVEASAVTAVSRVKDLVDTKSFDVKQPKITIPDEKLAAEIPKLLEIIQKSLYEESKKFTESNLRPASNYDEFKKIMKEHKGFVKVNWSENSKDEDQIQKETKATSRCRLPEKSSGKCFYTGKPTDQVWLFAQAY